MDRPIRDPRSHGRLDRLTAAEDRLTREEQLSVIGVPRDQPVEVLIRQVAREALVQRGKLITDRHLDYWRVAGPNAKAALSSLRRRISRSSSEWTSRLGRSSAAHSEQRYCRVSPCVLTPRSEKSGEPAAVSSPHMTHGSACLAMVPPLVIRIFSTHNLGRPTGHVKKPIAARSSLTSWLTTRTQAVPPERVGFRPEGQARRLLTPHQIHLRLVWQGRSGEELPWSCGACSRR